jgi:hypothetical protein
LGCGCQAQNARSITLGRLVAVEIPREWFVARIEGVASRVLNLEDEWEYRRLLELYSGVDEGLLRRLIAHGLGSANADIREAAVEGLAFRNRVEEESLTKGESPSEMQ